MREVSAKLFQQGEGERDIQKSDFKLGLLSGDNAGNTGTGQRCNDGWPIISALFQQGAGRDTP